MLSQVKVGCCGWTPGEELRAAVEEWQAKRRPLSEGIPRLTTGFLDGTHPIVDAYELKVGCLIRLHVSWYQTALTGQTVAGLVSGRLPRNAFASWCISVADEPVR